MVIDSERAARRLVAVGVDEDTATAIADIVADATEGLASKEDIADLKVDNAELRVELAALRADNAKSEARNARAMWYLGIGIIAGNAAIQTIIATIG